MEYFAYGSTEIEYLARKDPKMGELIEKYGKIQRQMRQNLFEALVHSIVSQQISTKAADTVWGRIKEICPVIDGKSLCEGGLGKVQACGMSLRKAGYILGAAQAQAEGDMDFDSLKNMEDSQVIAALSALNGVGVWTAEMLMIFSMGRQDVLSYGDFGIRKGLCLLHNLPEINKGEFVKYKELYSPYGSVAALYLWALSADN